MDANSFYVDGVLKSTVTKTTFRTSADLMLFHSAASTYNKMRGKILYVDLRNVVDSNGDALNDMFLVPVLDQYDTPSMLDVRNSTAESLKIYYNADSASTFGYSQPTNEIAFYKNV